MPEFVTAGYLERCPEVIELPTGHCPQWSQPEMVAELLATRAEDLAPA